MKNSTLLFRSFVIIILITGSAHLVSYINSGYSNKEYLQEGKTTSIYTKEKIPNTEEANYILGKWKVSYNTKEFKGTIIHNLKKEGNVINAYTYEYQDQKGHKQKAKGTKVLSIENFDGYKGKGTYKIEYDAEQYDVKCVIDMIDKNTFKLSYDYYGYGDIETWKRQ